MKENPTAKYVKFWFRATLLINFERASVIVTVDPYLAMLQIMHVFFGFRVISVKNNMSTEIQEEFTENVITPYCKDKSFILLSNVGSFCIAIHRVPFCT